MRKAVFFILTAFVLQGCGPPARKFYPIGIYTVPTEKAFSDAHEAGFNTVHVYDSKPETILKAVDLAKRLDLRLVCHPGHDPRLDGSFDANRVDQILSKLQYNRTILAWYLYDEPEAHGLRADLLHNFHMYVKERSPHIPTVFVVGNGEKYRDFAGCSDIAMLDWYPIPLYPLESIGHHIRECRAYTTRGQPVWMVLQAFDWTRFSETVRRKGTGRVPSYEELKFMTYLAVVEGVDGLFYWTYQTPRKKWVILDHPELWNDLRKVVEELNVYYAFLLSINDVDGVTVVENGKPTTGRIRFIMRKVSRSDLRKAGRITAQHTALNIRPGYYLSAVNGSGEEINAEFSGLGIDDQDVEELFSKGLLGLRGGEMIDRFSPYEVKLYYLGK